MALYHLKARPPKPRLFTRYCESSRRKTFVFMHKTQPVPAGYVVNKIGLGGRPIEMIQNHKGGLDSASRMSKSARE